MKTPSAITAILLLSALSAAAASAPIEVWLSPERRAALGQIAKRPYVVRQERIDDNTVVSYWTNSPHLAVETQRVQRVFGAPARSAWRDRIDAAERAKDGLLDDLKAIRENPTKKNVEAVINKHDKKNN